MFGGSWEKIEGKVIASDVAKIIGGGSTGGAVQTKWKYVVEFTVDGEDARRAEVTQEWGVLGKRMINPQVGRTVPLLLDRRSGKVRFDWKDPRLNAAAQYEADKAKRSADFDAKLKGSARPIG